MQDNETVTQTESTAPEAAVSEPTSPPPPQEAPPVQTRTISFETLALIPLVLIIVLGGYFRFVGLNWDSFTHLHPDERFLTIVTTKLETVSDPLLYLRTSESPLNPYNKGEGFYVYGNFPMTVTRYVAEWAETLRSTCAAESEALLCQNVLTGYDGVHLIGRLLSAVMDLLSILFIFFIGRRLYGTRVGLIAAFLLATAVMPIQQSHFYTMDNWAAALTTLTFYTAVRASEAGQKKRWWILFGIGLGLTVASRINVAPLAAMAGVAAIVWLVRRYQAAGEKISFWRYLLTAGGSLDFQYALLGVLMAALVSILVFRVAQPYAFAGQELARQTYMNETGREPSTLRLILQSAIGFNPQWRANLEEIQRLQAPEANFPPALQWTDRTDVLFPLTNMILYGMGLLAGIAAWVGFCWALWRIAKAKPDWLIHALPVSWVGLYFLFSATRWVKSIRYFLPIYPMLFLLAGWLLIELWRKSEAKTIQRAVVGVAAALTLISSLLWANAFVEIYRQPMTRVAASEWMFENIPSAATLIYEDESGMEHEIQLPLMEFDFQPGQPAFPLNFTMPETGTATAVRLNYLKTVDDNTAAATIQVGLNGQLGRPNTAETSHTVTLNAERQTVTIDLPPTLLNKGSQVVHINAAADGAAFRAKTSVITSEHWDDALPSRTGGRDPYSQYFRGLEVGAMPTTHPDSEEKRFDIYRWLEEADYIVLSSQRSLWSLPRLPLTYPLMTQYYEGLFNEELGFELAAEFHGDIHIGPLYISDTGGKVNWGAPPEIGWPPPGDLAAEEAFSVYDHPPVWIFKKSDNFNINQAIAYLDDVDVSQTVVMNPLEATNAPNAMQLTPEQQAIQQENGTFSRVFNPDGILSNNSFVAAVAWWLTVIFLGWLTFPLTFAIFRGLSDRGYALSRILSLLILSYFTWL
ncbi:MAG: glycosyltransferase family 39 protein, partial [Anaerolineales bacterium]|nr:glycosyltransferase family 39 protein [Anaerolineales bacterium]